MTNITIVMCSCLNKPERENYLKESVNSFRSLLPDSEIIICFDKFGLDEVDGADICYTHEKGMGHSWNWGIKKAKHDIVLQTEDDWKVLIGGANEENLPDKEAFYRHLKNRIEVVEELDGIFKFTNIDDSFWSSGKAPMDHDGYKFSELNRPKTYKHGTWDMYYYSNQPHMKKKTVHDQIGWFKKNAPPHEVEIDMCEKFYKSGQRTFLCPFFTTVHIGYVASRSGSA